jgi:hypothetical protein
VAAAETRSRESRRVPTTVVVTVVLTALEALGFAAYGLALVPELFGAHPEAGSTASLFFLAYAGFLGVCAWQLWRLRSWARAPVVLAQLIQVLVGAGFWGGDTTAVAVGLVGLAVVVLVALLHPRSTAALGAP